MEIGLEADLKQQISVDMAYQKRMLVIIDFVHNACGLDRSYKTEPSQGIIDCMKNKSSKLIEMAQFSDQEFDSHFSSFYNLPPFQSFLKKPIRIPDELLQNDDNDDEDDDDYDEDDNDF